jgi:hypothetical protein
MSKQESAPQRACSLARCKHVHTPTCNARVTCALAPRPKTLCWKEKQEKQRAPLSGGSSAHQSCPHRISLHSRQLKQPTDQHAGPTYCICIAIFIALIAVHLSSVTKQHTVLLTGCGQPTPLPNKSVTWLSALGIPNSTWHSDLVS